MSDVSGFASEMKSLKMCCLKAIARREREKREATKCAG